MDDVYGGGRGPLDTMRSLEHYLPEHGGQRNAGRVIIKILKVQDSNIQEMSQYGFIICSILNQNF